MDPLGFALPVPVSVPFIFWCKTEMKCAAQGDTARWQRSLAGMKLETSRLRLGSFPRGTADEQFANGSATFTFPDNAEVAPCPALPASAVLK